MTCVAALIENGRVWMGGDSLITDGDSHYTEAQPKVWKIGDAVLGVCGEMRPCSLLKYDLQLKNEPPDTGLDRWANIEFTHAVRQCFRRNGFEIVRDADDEDNNTDFGLLIGVYGRLYQLDADLYVGRIKAPYYATGSGGHVALGALGATVGSGYVPSQRLEMALELAEQWCSGVRRPWTVMHT